MPPKKDDKKDKKVKDEGPDPKQEISRFKKEYQRVSLELQVDPLPLHVGDESEVFRKMLLHPHLVKPNAEGVVAPLTPLHAKALVGGLSIYAHLQTLCIWNANVQDEGAVAVGAYIAQNRSVTSLEMPDCGIGALGCKAIADAMERNMTLTRLCLDYNQIGSAGVEVLGGLRFNRCIRELELSHCGLTPEDGNRLAEGVMRSPTLKVIELRGNALQTEGAMAVLGAVKRGGALFHCGLADTGFGCREPEAQAFVLDVMTTVTTCCEYDFLGNTLGDGFCYEMLKLTRTHGHLIDIRVCATCGIDPLLFKQLLDVCAANKKEWIKANKKKGKGGKKGKKKK